MEQREGGEDAQVEMQIDPVDSPTEAAEISDGDKEDGEGVKQEQHRKRGRERAAAQVAVPNDDEELDSPSKRPQHGDAPLSGNELRALLLGHVNEMKDAWNTFHGRLEQVESKQGAQSVDLGLLKTRTAVLEKDAATHRHLQEQTSKNLDELTEEVKSMKVQLDSLQAPAASHKHPAAPGPPLPAGGDPWGDYLRQRRAAGGSNDDGKGVMAPGETLQEEICFTPEKAWAENSFFVEDGGDGCGKEICWHLDGEENPNLQITQGSSNLRMKRDKGAKLTSFCPGIYMFRRVGDVPDSGTTIPVLDGSGERFLMVSSLKRRMLLAPPDFPNIEPTGSEFTVREHLASKMTDEAIVDWDERLQEMVDAVDIRGEFVEFSLLDVRLAAELLFYQDDIFVIDKQLGSLARRIRAVGRGLERAGLLLAAKKTKIIASPAFSGARRVRLGSDEFCIAPSSESIKVLGVNFSLFEKPNQQALELLARTRAAAGMHRDILGAKGSWTNKMKMLRCLVESRFTWCAGALHWGNEELQAANTLQLHILRSAFQLRRLSGESWLDWNTRSMRFVRVWLHNGGWLRWSDRILKLSSNSTFMGIGVAVRKYSQALDLPHLVCRCGLLCGGALHGGVNNKLSKSLDFAILVTSLQVTLNASSVKLWAITGQS
ncbi:pol [Symbiodinium sp. CCMP2456]|nr:pol [Symbiodinium sp. CCMP2456]